MAAHGAEVRGESRHRRRHVPEPIPLPAVGRLEEAGRLGIGRILGIDTDIRAADYMRYKARHYGVPHIHKTLDGCLKELKEELMGIVDSLKLP